MRRNGETEQRSGTLARAGRHASPIGAANRRQSGSYRAHSIVEGDDGVIRSGAAPSAELIPANYNLTNRP